MTVAKVREHFTQMLTVEAECDFLPIEEEFPYCLNTETDLKLQKLMDSYIERITEEIVKFSEEADLIVRCNQE